MRKRGTAKRRHTDAGEAEQEEDEIPVKKLKLDPSHFSRLSKIETAKKSPSDSAYGSSFEKSPYFSFPSVENSSGLGWSPQAPASSLSDPKSLSSPTDGRRFSSHDDLSLHFRTNYKDIKDELDPKHGLADRLYASGVINRRGLEEINIEEPSRLRRADKLIKAIVHSSKASIFGVVPKVWDAFIGEKLEYLLPSVKDVAKEDHARNPILTGDSEETDDFFLSELQFMAKTLEDNLEPRDIIDDLLEEGVLTFLDHEDIYKITSRLDRVKTLVDLVKRAGKHKFYMFEKALSTSCPHLTKHRGDIHLQHLLPAKEICLELTPKDHESSPRCEPTAWNAAVSASMIELKININGPDSVQDVEMSVVDSNNSALNLNLEEEAMEIGYGSVISIEYSSVKITMAALSEDTVSKFRKALHNPVDLQRLVNKLFTQEQLRILDERKIDTVKIEMIIPGKSIQKRTCSCKLTKEIIVKSYSYLEQELKNIKPLIEAFVDTTLLDKEQKQKLVSLRDTRSSVAMFLRQLLTMPEECICFFEQQLKQYGQQYLIEKIIEEQNSEDSIEKWTNSSDKGNKRASYPIGTKEIRHNYSFLMNELEPKIFISCFENTDVKIEDIIASGNRRQRCKLFLDSLVKNGQPAIEKFRRELERQNMHFVIDVLCRRENDKDIQKNIMKHYSTILDELEPTRLREKLVYEKVFKAKEFDEILKVSSQRRQRVVWLIRKLLHKDSNSIAIFCDALKISNYADLAALLTTHSAENLGCPFLKSKLEERNGDQPSWGQFRYIAEFAVGWKKERPTESKLQLSLHKEIYAKKVDKHEYTNSWVDNHLNISGIDGEDIQESDAGIHASHRSDQAKLLRFPSISDSSSSSQTFARVSEIDNLDTCFASSVSHTVSNIELDISKATAESDTCSVPSITRSPYTNKCEDTKQSVFSSHHQYELLLLANKHRQTHGLRPVSPCGSGGIACNSSDSNSPLPSSRIVDVKQNTSETH